MTQSILGSLDIASLYQLVERGGPVVMILLAMSIAALAVALLKLVQFLYLGVGRDRGLRAGLADWRAGNHQAAIGRVAARAGSAPSVAAHTMRLLGAGASPEAAREEAERVAQGHLASLRAHLRVLEATSQVAPLLGLFGTVLGMMSAFQALQSAGADADPAALAGGIWVALITTAVGLAIAIPAGLALYWFEGRLEAEAVVMENTISELCNTARIPSQGAMLIEAASGVSGGRHAAE